MNLDDLILPIIGVLGVRLLSKGPGGGKPAATEPEPPHRGRGEGPDFVQERQGQWTYVGAELDPGLLDVTRGTVVPGRRALVDALLPRGVYPQPTPAYPTPTEPVPDVWAGAERPPEEIDEANAAQLRNLRIAFGRYGLPSAHDWENYGWYLASDPAGEEAMRYFRSIQLMWYEATRLTQALLDYPPLGLYAGVPEGGAGGAMRQTEAVCPPGHWLTWHLIPEIYRWARATVPRNLVEGWEPVAVPTVRTVPCPPGTPEPEGWFHDVRCIEELTLPPFGPQGQADPSPQRQYIDAASVLMPGAPEGPVAPTAATAYSFARIMAALEAIFDRDGTINLDAVQPVCLPLGPIYPLWDKPRMSRWPGSREGDEWADTVIPYSRISQPVA